MAVTKRRMKVKSNYSFPARSKRIVFLLLPTRLSVFLFRRFIDDNRERNSLEAAKFLESACLLYGSEYYFSPRYLRFCLNLADSKLPTSFTKLLFSSLMQVRKDPALRKVICEELFTATRKLNTHQCSAQSWKFVSLALTGFGFIRAGTVARNNCIEVAIFEESKGIASVRTINLAVRGLLETRRFSEAEVLIEKHAEHQFLNQTNHLIYLSMLQEKTRRTTTFFNGDYEKDEFFSKVVRGKEVALVATGEILTHTGSDIDSHETVARVKFQGDAITPEERLAGSRCDTTFYTEDLINKFEKKAKEDAASLSFLERVKILVSKESTLTKVGTYPIRLLSWRAPTFLTTATSGTLFLYEILCFNPKKIKLFGFDFYTKRSLYNSSLLKHYETKNALSDIGLPKNWFKFSSKRKTSAIIAGGFINHDPKSDFLLIKNLYELSGLIDGTPEVLALLNLTADEYDLKLEEMLGDW